MTVTWTSKEMKPISWNDLYSQKHWSARKKLKDNWKLFFLSKIDKSRFDKFTIEMTANSNHDIDNLSLMLKLFVDTLRWNKNIKNDTPQYFRGFSIKPDETLPENTFKVVCLIKIND